MSEFIILQFLKSNQIVHSVSWDFIINNTSIITFTLQKELRSIFQSASTSEWVLAIATISYVLTFIPSFRKLEFDGFNVKFKQLATNSKTVSIIT